MWLTGWYGGNKMNTLIVSNNCLSYTKNNGKTLKNIFNKMIAQKKICSLYFSYENKELDIPTCNINEKKLLNIIYKNKKNTEVSLKNEFKQYMQPNEGIRILRELVWLIPKWKKICNNFVKENDISSIFFLAGDSMFSYRIVMYLKKKFNLSLIVYYTDDYYFKKYRGFFGIIRKKMICRYIDSTISKCDRLYVISPKMKKAYSDYFRLDCQLLGIIPEQNLICSYSDETKARDIIFTYIGNVGIGRFDVIKNLAKIVDEVNTKYNVSIKVKIFTNSKISNFEINQLKLNDNVIVGGNLNQKQVLMEIEKSDYLIFVESFDNNNIEITKYSFSTKIMEYLAFGKNIIAIGPKEASSIELLSEVSICFQTNNYTAAELYSAMTNTNKCKNNRKYAQELYKSIRKEFEISINEINEYLYEICS